MEEYFLFFHASMFQFHAKIESECSIDINEMDRLIKKVCFYRLLINFVSPCVQCFHVLINPP